MTTNEFQQYVERRTRKNTFIRQIYQIIDRSSIEKEIIKFIKKEKWILETNSCRSRLHGSWYIL